MGRINDQNYYQVCGWMINKLGLAGRELHAYAIIYGFTQDGATEFNGSLTYIAEFLGSSRRTAINVMNSLVEKGLITKTQVNTPAGQRNYYTAIIPNFSESTKVVQNLPQVVQKLHGGSEKIAPKVVQKLHGGSEKTAPNNNKDNYINNNIDNLLGETDEKNDLIPYQKIKELYNATCTDLPKVVTISPHRKKAIAARWKEYKGNFETFKTLFETAQASSFLKGANERNWAATFDWLLKADNMAKVLEGNYRDKGAVRNANKAGAAGIASGNGSAGAAKKAITTAELEDQLRKAGQFKGYPDFDAMFGGKGA